MFQFEELDEVTRKFMLQEFERDFAAGTLYLSDRLTATGKTTYPELLRQAIKDGNERTLTQSLQHSGFWNTQEQRVRQGKPYLAAMPRNAAEVLAEGEFNVFYMRGLACKLIGEGQAQAEVYRAKVVENPRAGERVNPGDLVPCQEVLDDLRSREEGASKVGIPRGPASGLCMRRCSK